MVYPYTTRHAGALYVHFEWVVVVPGTTAYDAIPAVIESAAFAHTVG